MKSLFRALLCSLALCLLPAIAPAATISMQSVTIAGWNDTHSSGIELWIFADRDWIDAAGTPHLPGNTQNRVVSQRVSCTVNTVARTITIPSFSLTSTTDALQGPTVRLSAYIVYVSGASFQVITPYAGFDSFRVPSSIVSISGCSPSGTCATWYDISAWNKSRVPLQPDSSYTKDETIRLIQAALAGATPSWGSIIGILTNQSDLNAALALKAPLASPTFTGTVTVPAPSGSTDAATKGYVDTNGGSNRVLKAGDTMSGNLQFSGSATIDLPEFTVAGLPVAGNAGRVVKVSDGLRALYVDTGSAWVPVDRFINPKLFGAVGDGSTNDSTALNAAITAASSAGVPVALDGGVTYGVGASLDGSLANVRIVGIGGRATLKKINAGATAYIVAITGGYYRGWQFENIEFNGNSAVTGGLGGLTIALSDTTNITFRNCGFRDLVSTLYVVATRNVRFYQCDFWGTLAGVMASGAQDPTANSSAAYAQALNIGDGAEDILVDGGTFHFCLAGLQQSASANKPTRGLRVINSTFRGDWWNSPYKLLYFTPTNYNNSTKVLTVSGGGFTGHFPAGQYYIVSIPVSIATGSSFSAVAQGTITTSGSFGTAAIGDSLETSDGKRAEVVGVTSTTSIQIAGWESVDTYEPTTQPALATSWRVQRYYAAGANFTSDTTITLYSEPVNPFTGSRMVTDDGLTPVGKNCRELSKTVYSGIHLNASAYDVVIHNNRLRGSWADQISIFNCYGPRITDNTIEYTQDEGTTLTSTPHAVVMGNVYRKLGTSAVAHSSDYAVISGNTFDTWGVINRGGLGAIDGVATYVSITGNTAQVAAGGAGSGSIYLVNFGYAAAATGSNISGNTDGGARTATLNTDAANGVFYGRDLVSLSGGGTASVFAVQGPVTLNTSINTKGLVLTPPSATWTDITANSSANGVRIASGASYGDGAGLQLFPDGNAFKGIYFDLGGVSGADLFVRRSGVTVATIKQSTGGLTLTPASGAGLTVTTSTNQIVLGTTNTTTITMASLTGSRTVTFPDANSNTVQPASAGSNQFATGVSSAGVISFAQPAFSNLSGTASKGQLPGTTVYTDQANTYSTGAQDFGSAASLKVPTGAGAAPTTSGFLAYDSTANRFSGGVNGANKLFVSTDSTDTLTNKTISGASNTLSNIGNSALSNSTITSNAGSNFGMTTPGSVSLGGTGVFGNTSDNLRFNGLGLGVAAPTTAGQIAATLGANNVTGWLIKRNTDTSPTGNYVDWQTAAGASLFKVDITGSPTIAAPVVLNQTPSGPGNWQDIHPASTTGLRIFSGASYGDGAAFQMFPDNGSFPGMYFDSGTASGADIRYRDAPNGSTNMLIRATGSSGARVAITSPSASKEPLQVNSAASPSVDIAQFTVNGSTTAGTYTGVGKGGTVFTPKATYTGAVGTTTLNLANGNIQVFTFGAGNETIALSNIPNSAVIVLSVIQDATGSRTITWPATVKWVGGTAPTLTTTANRRDVFTFFSDGTNLYEMSRAIDVR